MDPNERDFLKFCFKSHGVFDEDDADERNIPRKKLQRTYVQEKPPPVRVNLTKLVKLDEIKTESVHTWKPPSGGAHQWDRITPSKEGGGETKLTYAEVLKKNLHVKKH